MNNQENTVQVEEKAKLDYEAPKLIEHGNVEEVTLQTFFGTFSPPSH